VLTDAFVLFAAVAAIGNDVHSFAFLCAAGGTSLSRRPKSRSSKLPSYRCPANRDVKSAIIKRSINLTDRRTSITLEDPFWEALDEIGRRRGSSRMDLILQIDRTRGGDSLSSSLRVFVIENIRIK
jgi:predicted DNA-binding ribbon-helix-helix protein